MLLPRSQSWKPTHGAVWWAAIGTLWLASVGSVSGHVAVWHPGMYCLNGTSGRDDPNTNQIVNPLFQLNESDWWFHHVDKCDEFPPAPGDFLELPANGAFTVELAVNRAFTTLSYNGMNAGIYPDGQNRISLSQGRDGKSACISEPNIHTQSQSMASGTAFAISYTSDLTSVTKENLVVFTVLYNTPWQRLATYSVPNLPACPEPEGCICAVSSPGVGYLMGKKTLPTSPSLPRLTSSSTRCGEPNMYMEGFKCRVTGSTGNASVSQGVPPVWCEDDPDQCVKGAKQMVYWNQLEGNNVFVSGVDNAGSPKAPSYNEKMGFKNGAQTCV
ncbi:hypothetical protein CVT24_003481 [Panaeolus cyanescens]|uniref:Uncharacterized protein n=1 Tax=Panaeolus cyanescens TaxID=181874 RepID=A0A409Y7P2_9AGAR|nr:hypothetical protein CVT24_003481 [Panaeolus cyanescens]